MIKGSQSYNSVKRSLKIANIVKFYALIILITDILFICFIGEKEDNNQRGNIWLKENYPKVWNFLPFIGFRPNTITDDEEAAARSMKYKFLGYITYFLLSIYLANYLED